MQAVISTCSKSKYYNGDPDDEHVPEDLGATERDEIGIVHAICVKARSLAQHKEAFKAIQYCHKLPPLQLLLDMKVWWSSTFMLRPGPFYLIFLILQTLSRMTHGEHRIVSGDSPTVLFHDVA